MMDEKSIQKRAIIATLLAFIFFIAYDSFYLSKFRDTNATIATKQVKTANEAPNVKLYNQNKAPINTVSKEDKTIVNISSDYFNAKIDSLGRISSFKLNENIYKDEEGNFLNLITQYPKPLEIRFANQEINKLAFEIPYEASVSNMDLNDGEKSVVLTQNLGEVIVKKTITFSKRGAYRVKVETNKNENYFVTPGLRPDVAADRLTIHGVLLRNLEDNLEIVKDGKVKNKAQTYNNIDIASSFDRYYTTLFYNFEKPMKVALNETSDGVNQAFVAVEDRVFEAGGFIGPKNHELLKSINPELSDVIEYGWFTFIAKPMFWLLSKFYTMVGNWGWAIVILTILIRLILSPLTYKAMISMNKLKDLAPKMKEIREKYKNDPQKMQAQVMDLYRKHGANPMGGCLPMILQIPVFFAIYRVLLNAIELQGAPWILWIDNLAIKDPYFILPIIMGAAMYIQQRLTPTSFTDPMQEKIMKFLPVIFIFFFMTFPAGLTLYWCVNNIFALIQQIIINKMFKKRKELEMAEKK